jgi:hypothetical protein
MKRIFYTSLIATFIMTLMSFTGKLQVQDPVSVIVEEIAKHNVYEFGKLGYTGLKSKQYDRYLKLMELATDDQLLQLTGHSNVVVRIYAYHACEKRNIPLSQEVLSKYRRDSSRVKMINGCEAFVTTVQKLTVGELEVRTNSSKVVINGGPGENE